MEGLTLIIIFSSKVETRPLKVIGSTSIVWESSRVRGTFCPNFFLKSLRKGASHAWNPKGKIKNKENITVKLQQRKSLITKHSIMSIILSIISDNS